MNSKRLFSNLTNLPHKRRKVFMLVFFFMILACTDKDAPLTYTLDNQVCIEIDPIARTSKFYADGETITYNKTKSYSVYPLHKTRLHIIKRKFGKPSTWLVGEVKIISDIKSETMQSWFEKNAGCYPDDISEPFRIWLRYELSRDLFTDKPQWIKKVAKRMYGIELEIIMYENPKEIDRVNIFELDPLPISLDGDLWGPWELMGFNCD